MTEMYEMINVTLKCDVEITFVLCTSKAQRLPRLLFAHKILLVSSDKSDITAIKTPFNRQIIQFEFSPT